MKIGSEHNALRRLGIVASMVAIMTAGFWMLHQSGATVATAQSTLGGPLPNLTPLETTMFNTGAIPFAKAWDPQQGLGPVYTQLSSQACHGSPAAGGNSSNIAPLELPTQKPRYYRAGLYTAKAQKRRFRPDSGLKNIS